MDANVDKQSQPSQPSLQLITYQLGELSKSVEKLTTSFEQNVTQLGMRVTAIELKLASDNGAETDRKWVITTIVAIIVALGTLLVAAKDVLK